MAFLTTQEQADIRAHLTATLPDTCTIAYPTVVKDGMGGWTETWTNRGTAIACRLAPGGGGGRITQEQVKEGLTWTLSLDYAQAVDVKDKVTTGGRTFRAITINRAESEIGLKRVTLELLE